MTGGALTWKYRCSFCGSLIKVDDVSTHVQSHRSDPRYDGVIHMTRVDEGGGDA